MVLLQSEPNANESPPPKERHDKVLEIPNFALRRNLHIERAAIDPYKTHKRGNPSPVQIDTCITQDNS